MAAIAASTAAWSDEVDSMNVVVRSGRRLDVEHGHVRGAELGEHLDQAGADAGGRAGDDDALALVAEWVTHAPHTLIAENTSDVMVSSTTASSEMRSPSASWRTAPAHDPAGDAHRRLVHHVGHVDVRRERRFVAALVDDVHVRAVVAKRIRTVAPVFGLPRHHGVAAGHVGPGELRPRDGVGVGAAREVHVFGQQAGEHVEVALVVVEPPLAEQVGERGRIDHVSPPRTTGKSNSVTLFCGHAVRNQRSPTRRLR